MKLREITRGGLPFHVRDYQREAADIFYAGGDVRGGSGVIVLPCGAGKTIGIQACSRSRGTSSCVPDGSVGTGCDGLSG
jgi:superfamily II DNA or RNA helicase